MARPLIVRITLVCTACVLLATNACAHPSWGIVVDRQGQVYFSDLVTVWKIDDRGKLSIFRAGGDWHTHDLSIDEAGNLYGADNSYEPRTQRFFSAVWKMTPEGGFTYLLAPTDKPPQGTSIRRDHTGNVYHVTEYPGRELLVLKRTAGGDVTVLVGNNDAAREYRQAVPYGVSGTAFGPDGSLYFTHGANVSKVTTSGALVALARNVMVEGASENRGRGAPLFGIAVNTQGDAFMADHGNRRVLKIAPSGQMTTLIRAEESWFPTGVAVSGNDLYVLEHKFTPAHAPLGTRVRKLSPDGAVTVLGAVGEHGTPRGSTPAGDNPSGESSERVAEPKRNIPSALIGAGMGAFALTLAVWLVRRGRYAGRGRNA